MREKITALLFAPLGVLANRKFWRFSSCSCRYRGRAQDKLLRHEMCRSLWRGKAAGDEVRLSGSLHHGRLRIFLLAFPAGIGVVPVLHNHCLGRDQLQTPAYFLANFGHGTPAFRADQFLLRKTVFHHLHRYVFRQLVQRIFMLLVPLMGSNDHTAVIFFRSLLPFISC